jgi:hypothetical protein
MPANRRSLQVTNSYRQRLDAIRERIRRLSAERWPTIEELDTSDWADRTAAAVAQAQTEAVRVTSGYLSAYLTSELGKRTSGPTILSRSYAGKSRDGRSLTDAFQSPLIGVRAALAQGKTPPEALRYGFDRARRMVGVDFDAAHRTALLDAIKADERFKGWRRVTTGTCGACADLAGELNDEIRFEVHPGCGCVSQPVVKGLPETVAVLTGVEIFASKTEAEQDEMLGPEAAELVREGKVQLSDLVKRSSLDEAPDFITQRPVSELQVT